LAVNASITFWKSCCSVPDHSASTWIDFPDRSGSAGPAAADEDAEDAEEAGEVLDDPAPLLDEPDDGFEEPEEQPASARPDTSPTARTDRYEREPMISLLSTRVRDLS
jgi:hypothetical protein